MNLNLRLALSLGAVLTFSFLLFGLAEYTTLRRAFLQEIDRSLALRGEALVRRLQEGSSLEGLALDEDPLAESASPEVFVEILGAEGAVIAVSENLREARLPLDPGQPLGSFRTVQVPGEPPLRILILAVQRGGVITAKVAVGHSLRLPFAFLQHSVGQLVGVGLTTLLLTVLVSILAVQRGLQPVRQVSRTAQWILETGDVSRRVPPQETSDVVGQLANTFNAMLSRIEQGMQAQKRLLADTSHELRNPLTVLQTDLDLLARELEPEMRLEVAREASAEAGRMIRLVEQLLLLESVEGGRAELEAVRLDELAASVVARSQGLAGERSIALTLEVEGEALVQGDRDQLRQVLLNLLGNALIYTRSGGRVTVRVGRAGRRVRLEVEDDGPGIAPEHIPFLFERFYRLEPDRSRSTGGVGLGLPVTRALVEAHGGVVEVHSRVGEGSRFTVLLPMEEE